MVTMTVTMMKLGKRPGSQLAWSRHRVAGLKSHSPVPPYMGSAACGAVCGLLGCRQRQNKVWGTPFSGLADPAWLLQWGMYPKT